MPFTPSHAVVALPFIRSPLVAGAIAVGAMTPDLPLFTRGVPVTYAVTHDLRWLPLTVLLALALFALWRVVLRPAVRELSPVWLAARLPTSWDRGGGDALRALAGGSARGVGLLVASLTIGVASHVAWDLFTHEGRWGSFVVPALAQEWGPFPGYRWLQHGSSVLGGAVLAVWALLWLRRRSPSRAPDRLLPAPVRIGAWLSLPAVLLLAWGAGLVALGPLTGEFTPAHLAYRVLPPAAAWWAVAAVGLCLAVHVLRRRRQVAPT